MSAQSCSWCGAVADPESDPPVSLTWAHWVEDGRECAVCPACARTHVRDIEAKLDLALW